MKCSPRIIQRFNGPGGKTRLLDAFRLQSAVAANLQAAKALAKCAVLVELRKNREVIIQDGQDNDIYFILSGSVSIIVNGRPIALRNAGEHVGEMALLDTTARRSATVRTREPSVVAKVTEREFTKIANKHPELWRKLAVVIAERLRERNQFHKAPRSEPVIFIGSSSEGLTIAEAIRRYLKHLSVVPRLWADGVFECSSTTIESLMNIAREVDFAVLILTPDDVITGRNTTAAAPRDNVVFEIGLFMGALSRNRTYIVTPHKLDIKIPTDLLGLTCLRYHPRRGQSVAKTLQPVSRKLRELIKRHGAL